MHPMKHIQKDLLNDISCMLVSYGRDGVGCEFVQFIVLPDDFLMYRN